MDLRTKSVEQSIEDKLRVIDVNCRGPLILADLLGRPMAERRRGGILLMSSLAGTQGTPFVATYAATKAFNLVLAEGLWDELRESGVDVLACRAGATRTPAYEQSRPASQEAPLMEPGPVVVEALNAGTQPWSRRAATPVRIGTWPADRRSRFAAPDWIRPSRPASVKAPVAPGGTGRFIVHLRAPKRRGRYREAFNLLAENLGFMDDQGLVLKLRVTRRG